MSIQQPPPVQSVSLVTHEPQIVLKNEPPEPEIVEITIDDIVNSSDEEILSDSDIKDVDIVEHVLCEDLITTETVPKNILESKYSKSVETQVIVKNESAPFTRKNLNKTEDSNGLDNVDTDGQLVLNFSDDLNDISIRSEKSKCPKKADFTKSIRASETTSLKGNKEIIKVIKAAMVPVEPHEYTSLTKDKRVCNHCQRAFTKLDHLKMHIKRMHREVTTMYHCPDCSYKSKRKQSVRDHFIKHKDTKDIQWFQCHLCDMKFKFKYQLDRHAWVHLTHEQKQDKLKYCPLCGKGFTYKSNLRVHERFVHHKESLKRLKCQECEYTTLKEYVLKRHMKTQHMKTQEDHEQRYMKTQDVHEKRYRCDKCNFKTRLYYTLKMHEYIHLKSEEIQYLHCYHCAYKSFRKAHLRCHISNHFRKGEVTFHCYLCDFMTLKRNLITGHIKKHSKFKLRDLTHETEIDDQDLKYCCDRCDYKTYTKSYLKSHKIVHMKPEEIEYVYCYHCSFKAKRRGDLQKHIVKHFKNENVPFHCYICNFMTLKRDSIVKHIKKHSKVRSKSEIQEGR